MLYVKSKSLLLLSTIFAAISNPSPVFARRTAGYEVPGNPAVNWKSDCAPHGCLMWTQILRGKSDVPADPKDAREYIGLNVALARKTQQPEYFAFYTDPRATKDQGVFIAFARAEKSGGDWSMVLDQSGALKIPYTTCGELECMARVPAGLLVESSSKKPINLLSKFLSSDEILVLYTRDKHAYRTMIPLASFKETYNQVMALSLASPRG